MGNLIFSKTTQPNYMKKTLILTISALLIAAAQTVTAQTTIITDNFTITGAGDANTQLSSRQTGTQAFQTYTENGNVQTGNTGTNVGQPGAPGNSGYLLLANNAWAQLQLGFTDSIVNGSALNISFNLYTANPDPTVNGVDWLSFNIGKFQTPSPNQTQFGFLVTKNQGLYVFNSTIQQTSGVPTSVTSDAWKVILSGTAGGTGSPFDGTTFVQLYNLDDPAKSETGLGLVYSGQLTNPLGGASDSGSGRNGDYIGWYAYNTSVSGVGNLTVVTTPTPEPSVAMLLPAGLGLLALVRRFRRA
jgi:hypothetical protein